MSSIIKEIGDGQKVQSETQQKSMSSNWNQRLDYSTDNLVEMKAKAEIEVIIVTTIAAHHNQAKKVNVIRMAKIAVTLEVEVGRELKIGKDVEIDQRKKTNDRLEVEREINPQNIKISTKNKD